MAARDRPMSVPVIAWVWILTGVFTVLSAVTSLSALPMLGAVSGRLASMSSSPALQAAVFVLENLLWVVLGELALGLLAVVAGARFLQLRAWARGALELLCWLSLLSVLGAGAAWLMAMPRLAGMTSGTTGSPGVSATGVAVALVLTLALAFPFGLMIRHLRGTAIRDAIRRAACGGASVSHKERQP